VSKNTWYAIGGVCLAALLFQIFLHYQYVPVAGRYMRIDRLNGTSCYMPCIASPLPGPTAAPTPFDWAQAAARYTLESDRQNQRAIALAKAAPGTAARVASAGTDHAWSANTVDLAVQAALKRISDGHDPAGSYREQMNRIMSSSAPSPSASDEARMWRENPPPSLHSAQAETKLVCYCDEKGAGWRWEVHVDTGDVFYVNDNADLMKKYSLDAPTAGVASP
jgi:hypothetical protein